MAWTTVQPLIIDSVDRNLNRFVFCPSLQFTCVWHLPVCQKQSNSWLWSTCKRVLFLDERKYEHGYENDASSFVSCRIRW